MTKILYILRGLPGAGKSFVADSLAVDGEFPVFSADQFFEDADGNYKFDALLLHQAHLNCLSRTFEAMKNNVEKIFVANTFTTEYEITPYKQIAEENGYRFVSMIIENRHGSTNVHGCPEETIVKMRRRFTFKL